MHLEAPVRIRSDGGPQFKSNVWSVLVSTNFHESNGLAEAAVNAMEYFKKVKRACSTGSLDTEFIVVDKYASTWALAGADRFPSSTPVHHPYSSQRFFPE